jgi:hypothetical protein
VQGRDLWSLPDTGRYSVYPPHPPRESTVFGTTTGECRPQFFSDRRDQGVGGAGSVSARRSRDPACNPPRKQKTPATPLRRHSAPFNVLACGRETCASPVLLAFLRPLIRSARQLAVCQHGRSSGRSRFRLHGAAFDKAAFMSREQYRSELVEFPHARHNKGGAAGRRGRPTKGNSSGLGRGDSWQAKRSTTVVARSVTGWD